MFAATRVSDCLYYYYVMYIIIFTARAYIHVLYAYSNIYNDDNNNNITS